MTSNITLSHESIERRIYTIRELRVMLDSDLALLYGVTTTRLNEQVTRNLQRFPDTFMFQLAKRLSEFNVNPKTIRFHGETSKGFMRNFFADVFRRYLLPPNNLSVTPSQPLVTPVSISLSDVTDSLKNDPSKSEKVTHKPAPIQECYGVTDKIGNSSDGTTSQDENVVEFV